MRFSLMMLAIVFGMSNNKRLKIKHPNWEAIGFKPTDDAETWLDQLKSEGVDVDGPPEWKLHGGMYEPPLVLDPFSGGGSIPLEALRYWSVDLQEAYAGPGAALKSGSSASANGGQEGAGAESGGKEEAGPEEGREEGAEAAGREGRREGGTGA